MARIENTPTTESNLVAPRTTTIQARHVLSVSVSMSVAELEGLVELLRGIDSYALSASHSIIRDEFLREIDSIR